MMEEKKTNLSIAADVNTKAGTRWLLTTRKSIIANSHLLDVADKVYVRKTHMNILLESSFKRSIPSISYRGRLRLHTTYNIEDVADKIEHFFHVLKTQIDILLESGLKRSIPSISYR